MELRVNRNAWENHGRFWTHMANTSETRNTVLFSFMLKWALVIIICKTPIFILFKIFSVCERSCLCALRTSGTQMMAFGSKTFGWKHGDFIRLHWWILCEDLRICFASILKLFFPSFLNVHAERETFKTETVKSLNDSRNHVSEPH